MFNRIAAVCLSDNKFTIRNAIFLNISIKIVQKVQKSKRQKKFQKPDVHNPCLYTGGPLVFNIIFKIHIELGKKQQNGDCNGMYA